MEYFNKSGIFSKSYYEKLKNCDVVLPEELHSEPLKDGYWYAVTWYAFGFGIEIRKYEGKNSYTLFFEKNGIRNLWVTEEGNLDDVPEDKMPPFLNELIDLFYDRENLIEVESIDNYIKERELI